MSSPPGVTVKAASAAVTSPFVWGCHVIWVSRRGGMVRGWSGGQTLVSAVSTMTALGRAVASKSGAVQSPSNLRASRVSWKEAQTAGWVP